MPEGGNRFATAPCTQLSVQAIRDLENQHSVTIVKKPRPARPKIRSVIWQQPLKKRGGVQDGHVNKTYEYPQPQREVAYSHAEYVWGGENTPQVKSTMWQYLQRNEQYYQGAARSVPGPSYNQQAEVGPYRKYDHEEYERRRQLEQVPQITLQVPITDLNNLSKLNAYRRRLGLGPSKNLMSSAIYDHHPSAVDNYYEQKDVMRWVLHGSHDDDDAADLRQAREALQAKHQRRLYLEVLHKRVLRHSSGNISADLARSPETRSPQE
ncbi:hypothetical protein F5B22DRAFT_651885 [Xylaria bambusicola]|uniref:uncharacterized protein n=1 Tax=Xylaria bambusicola TaxID=326684 RepID=UPI002007288C|nr:uncharacterized protein F5B22DRAFT_651885 [Xylaria bambusicola]KAI0505259.1 hypothetical protein F5B22DRAFT_651885 [Xylaria bambusicola]